MWSSKILQKEDVAQLPTVDAFRVASRRLQLFVLISLLAALVAVVVPSTAAPASDQAQGSLTSLESGVLQQLNKIRASHHLTLLKESVRLDGAADAHSREMGADGYFEHTSFDGTAFWKRIDHWYGSDGYTSWSVGENLLWSSPGVDSVAALKLWMASPEHRANILKETWREIGISAVHVDNAPGAYHDLPVTIITTDFGARH